MNFREFCESALSNDMICIVDDILTGSPQNEAKTAYRFLLEDGKTILDREVDRFTLGQITVDYPFPHLIVKLK